MLSLTSKDLPSITGFGFLSSSGGGKEDMQDEMGITTRAPLSAVIKPGRTTGVHGWWRPNV